MVSTCAYRSLFYRLNIIKDLYAYRVSKTGASFMSVKEMLSLKTTIKIFKKFYVEFTISKIYFCVYIINQLLYS